MTSVIVIGAGVLGASTAYRLAQHGADVTVLEAGRAAGGTSTRSFAWTNAHNKLPHAYHALNADGMRAHRALAEELGDARWLHDGGCIEWAVTEEEQARQRTRIERLRGWEYRVEALSRAELASLAPDLAPPQGAELAFYPEEGWIDAAPLVAVLLAWVRALGGVVRTGVAVADIATAGGRATGVRLADGSMLGAGLVVNCAGATVNTVTPDRGLHVPMASTLGLLVVTAPAPTTLDRVVQAAGGLALRPDGAGRLLLHSQEEDDRLKEGTVAAAGLPAVARILAAASAVLPAAAGVPAEAVRLAHRPIPEDGHPAVGTLPGLDGYYVAVTHSGITLSGLLGRLIAEEALLGRRQDVLDPFRPARFFQAAGR